MFVMRKGQPLQFFGVVEFAPDGKLHRTVFAQGATGGRARVSAIAVAIGSEGEPKPEPPPKPSEAQTWAAIADNDELLEDALIYFGRVSVPDPVRHPPTFWFDIYKALECLLQRFGGETAFIALDWAPRDDVKRLKQTANWAGHARRKFPEPSPATTEQEAKDLLSGLVRKAFETKARHEAVTA
jgi:hypothetical protein